MMDVEQLLKNNILTLVLAAMAAFGFFLVAGISARFEIYSLAAPMLLLAIISSAGVLHHWDKIKKNINMLKENKTYVEENGDKV